MKAVICENLSKRYGQDTMAVDHINLQLEAGEIFGFLGPNGAGKTTTVKLLNGMLSPTVGSCRVLDYDPAQEPTKVHRLAGVVTEHAQMYDYLTGLENLAFYGMLYGINPVDSQKRAERLLAQLDLTAARDKKLAAYSTGMRQRLSLARAIIHEPKILFLDEPTSGLDPESTQDVNAMIKRLAEENGITVFLCTHQLRYAQEICTAYGLIDNGTLLASGTLQELRARVSSGITVRICADHVPPELSLQKLDVQRYETSMPEESEIPGLVAAIVNAGGNIYHVSARQPSLEEIYFTLIEKAEKEGKSHA